MQEEAESPTSFRSKRHQRAVPEEYNVNEPRLGRRESEPHSDEINYLYDVLTTNFPEDRVMWDLHHYFSVDGLELDMVFDISYFKELNISKRLTSYKAKEFDNRVPTMVINILSKSTWRIDIGEHVDYCRKVKIPLYVVFPAYHVATRYYKPPFLRVYILQPDGEYHIEELHEATIDGDQKDPTAIIDVSNLVPFRLGIKKRSVQLKPNSSLYHLILLDPEKLEVFPTETELTRKKAEEAEKIARKEKQRANKAEKKTEEAEKKAEEAEKIARKEKQRANKAEQRAKDLEDEIKELKEHLRDN